MYVVYTTYLHNIIYFLSYRVPNVIPIASFIYYNIDVQCLHRYNKVLRPGLQKGSWTEYEDAVVRHEVMMYGNGKIKWALIADKLPG